MSEEFKVLTLNCWGVFVPSCTVRKNDRLNAIAQHLIGGTYDVVLLQEIWQDDDYQKLQDALSYVYNFSNYFHCHTIGSGMCIFSKWPIENIMFHPYSVNGYPQFIHQADWYCGKGVGLARIITKNGFRINFYVTHLVARYELNRKLDRYHGHRTCQLIDLLQFIRCTSSSSDAIVIAGDFNLEPNTPDIAFFKSYLGVSDAWMDSLERYSNGPTSSPIPNEKTEIEGCTCDRADNPYRNDEWTKHYGNGERLDYIFYRTSSGPIDPVSAPASCRLTCQSSWLDLRKVPHDTDGLHYSDHVGVGARFTLNRVLHQEMAVRGRKGESEAAKSMEPVLLELADHINIGLARCRRERLLLIGILAIISLLLLLIFVYGPFRHWFLVLFILLLTAILSPLWFAILMSIVVDHTRERRALTNGGLVIQLILSQIKAMDESPSDPDTKASGDYPMLS
ncbi:Neutral sphingomyelinase [Fasciola hepatica]|uniref:sphingomyelin phosphodiesterase n=1 Tax=Fasciola hepatica TaxID=6192 RepID=A0A4E0QY95_FASHE|nr:Neutral sphingomyelinase [Fasciola hepatica]